METRSNRLPTSRYICVCLFAAIFLACLQLPLTAESIEKRFPKPTQNDVMFGASPIAAESDSVWCGGTLLDRRTDYSVNNLTGRFTFTKDLPCDTLIIRLFVLPAWLMAPAGNPVPPSRKFIALGGSDFSPATSANDARKISLSGNKSFSLAVGRGGDSRFSQGLNIDFDARLTSQVTVRGSISDRIGSSGSFTPGQGGTTILSELDKYFFEIDGPHIMARGGDIQAHSNRFLPDKRIKGISSAYTSDGFDAAADIGRPAGKFISQTIRGSDGRQGPYQAVNAAGRPSGVVPGSEKVYLDGRLLEGGSDRYYAIDYPSGRITFAPEVLITARSRIELDFEAAETEYEQAVIDGAGVVRLFDRRVTISAGGRRETDEKDRLRFGAWSEADIAVLRSAGDVASNATVDGAVAESGGAYIQIDSSGIEFYRYVGSGNGDLAVSFSLVGDGQGDYRYLGDAVYEFVGAGNGSFLPVVFLPLPSRNDYFFASLEAQPYDHGRIHVDFQGNEHDKNLYSALGDGDNFRSLVEGGLDHSDSLIAGSVEFRFRQSGYEAVTRINRPDFERLWALPGDSLSGDELLATSSWLLRNDRYTLSAVGGYASYKDVLRSHRLAFSGRLFNSARVSPYGDYSVGQSQHITNENARGLYERYMAGVTLMPVRRVFIDGGFDHELVKNTFDSIPVVERYSLYRAGARYRQTVVQVSRKVDFTSGFLGYKGPQLDKVELTSEENIGRLNLMVGGTLLEQKALDSDRGNRSERLYRTGFRFVPGSGWINIQATYRQNRQIARATNYRFIQVSDGEGEYRLEDGQYIADGEGDYIRIREETGAETEIILGEKSHNIQVYPGRLPVLHRWREILSQFALRLQTEIEEEQPGNDHRRIQWLLPWYSRSGVEYLRRVRREAYSVLMFPDHNFYILNFAYSNGFEELESGALLSRSRKEYDIDVKYDVSAEVRSVLSWKEKRGDEKGVGLASLRLVRNEYLAGLIIQNGPFRLSPQAGYIRIADNVSSGLGTGILFKTEVVYRRRERGEIRCDAQFISLDEKRVFAQPEYLVTDGSRFGQSVVVNAIANYDLGKSLRLTLRLSDRIYEGRVPEFTGRGELVARF